MESESMQSRSPTPTNDIEHFDQNLGSHVTEAVNNDDFVVYFTDNESENAETEPAKSPIGSSDGSVSTTWESLVPPFQGLNLQGFFPEFPVQEDLPTVPTYDQANRDVYPVTEKHDEALELSENEVPQNVDHQAEFDDGALHDLYHDHNVDPLQNEAPLRPGQRCFDGVQETATSHRANRRNSRRAAGNADEVASPGPSRLHRERNERNRMNQLRHRAQRMKAMKTLEKEDQKLKNFIKVLFGDDALQRLLNN